MCHIVLFYFLPNKLSIINQSVVIIDTTMSLIYIYIGDIMFLQELSVCMSVRLSVTNCVRSITLEQLYGSCNNSPQMFTRWRQCLECMLQPARFKVNV